MARLTTCTHCGSCYEESSEERANEAERLCGKCFEGRCLNRSYNGTATAFERAVALRAAESARLLPARNELHRESGRRAGE